jgi:8-oxo-dGTP pyrophosphatase MutT (NUDIX family)
LTDQHFIEQSGAIPYRLKKGKLEVMLITSRRRKRWVLPKGVVPWQMTPGDSAAKEAWEEAGIWGKISAMPLGCYEDQKWGLPARIEVYPLAVEYTLEIWPEVRFRRRKWFSLTKAIKRVERIELQELLAALPAFLARQEE